MNSRKSAGAARLSVEVFEEACRELLSLDNGLPFVLEPYERLIVADLLTGIRELHVRIPEENGKTTLLAAIALIHLLTTPDPRVVIGARNKDQAKILFNQAVKMVQGNATLERRLDIRDGTNEIRILGMKGGAGIRVIPADALTAHGGINTLVILDEMHALPGIELYRTLAGKIGKRLGQLITISTAGEPDSEYEVLWQNIVERSTSIGRCDESDGPWWPRATRYVGPQHIAWCWALEKGDDHEDLALVKLANPASWITVQTLQAKRDLPGWELAHWLKVVCNVPTRDQVLRFLAEGDWDDANVSEDCPEIPEGVPIILGADWGLSDDATAFCPLWFSEGAMMLLGRLEVLAPPRDGHDLTHNDIKARLVAINARNPITCIAHDESMGGKILTGLLSEWFPEADIVPVSPADANVAPLHFNDQLRGGRIKHTGDPELKRHLMNAVRVPIKNDPENYRIDRLKHSRHAPHLRAIREMDGAVAAVNAVWGAVGREPVDEPFVLFLG